MKLMFDAEGMGKKIKHYREQLGMTRDDLANAIDYPPYWIELLEDGYADTDPRMSAITDIANTLNVEPSWLLAWKPEDEE